jgi:hypothetical protein
MRSAWRRVLHDPSGPNRARLQACPALISQPLSGGGENGIPGGNGWSGVAIPLPPSRYSVDRTSARSKTCGAASWEHRRDYTPVPNRSPWEWAARQTFCNAWNAFRRTQLRRP